MKNEALSLNFQLYRVHRLKKFKTMQLTPIFMYELLVDDHVNHIFDNKDSVGFLVEIKMKMWI